MRLDGNRFGAILDLVVLARRRLVALLLGLVLAIGGCGSEAPDRTFELTVAAAGDIDALPVVLVDRTGLVTSFEVDAAGEALRSPTVVNPPGRENVLVVSWVGGVCDVTTSLLFEALANGHHVRLHTDHQQGGCVLAGILRSVTIHLSSAVPAGTVTAEVVD